MWEEYIVLLMLSQVIRTVTNAFQSVKLSTHEGFQPP